MDPTTRIYAGALLLLLVTVELGGRFLLSILRGQPPAVDFNDQRRYTLFRAGHAHAGVLILVALVLAPYLDAATLPGSVKSLSRVCFFAAPLLVSAGFFGGGASFRNERPGGLIRVVYVGAITLAVGLVALAVGLFR
jgi:hypothetical protein